MEVNKPPTGTVAHWANGLSKGIKKMSDEIETLRAENERLLEMTGMNNSAWSAMVKDAQRYRWVIERVAFMHVLNSLFGILDKPWDKPTIDAKIDEAIKESPI